MIIFITVILGLVTGSFLNVCVYRLPEGKSVIMPGSSCPHCGHKILWYDNIPVLSFLMLMGRCRFCKKRISTRYIVIELLTAILFTLVVINFGITPIALVYIIFCSSLIAATFIDFEHHIIPDEITCGGIIIGFAVSFLFPELHATANRLYAIRDSLLGAVTGAALIYAIAWFGTKLFSKKLKEIGEDSAMGMGDVKYLAMIGAFLGWKGALFVFFAAPFFGSVVGIVEKVRKKADIIPYGPYLSIAALVFIFWGNRILERILLY